MKVRDENKLEQMYPTVMKPRKAVCVCVCVCVCPCVQSYDHNVIL